MLQNSKGYFLVDALVGFSIFVVVLTSMTPMLYKVYQEKVSISHERYALEILHNNLQMWLDGEIQSQQETFIKNGINYNLERIEQLGKGVRICVSWESSNNRLYEICGNAK